jgi:hypothetical protein
MNQANILLSDETFTTKVNNHYQCPFLCTFLHYWIANELVTFHYNSDNPDHYLNISRQCYDQLQTQLEQYHQCTPSIKKLLEIFFFVSNKEDLQNCLDVGIKDIYITPLSLDNCQTAAIEFLLNKTPPKKTGTHVIKEELLNRTVQLFYRICNESSLEKFKALLQDLHSEACLELQSNEAISL